MLRAQVHNHSLGLTHTYTHTHTGERERERERELKSRIFWARPAVCGYLGFFSDPEINLQKSHNDLNDLKGLGNINYSMVRYGEGQMDVFIKDRNGIIVEILEYKESQGNKSSIKCISSTVRVVYLI